MTEDDLSAELRRIHEENHPELQPGEFTYQMYAESQKKPLDISEAEDRVQYLVRSGVFARVKGLRYVDGRMRAAFRVAKKEHG